MGEVNGKRGMTAGRIKGSSLVEAIVASVIFLVIFAISLDTVTRLTLKQTDSKLLVEVDYNMKCLFTEYGDGRHETGRHLHEFSWGTINIDLVPYKEYAELQQVTVKALISNSGRTIEHKHIIELLK